MNLRRMHELESQHFVAKESLIKYYLKEEVNSYCFSSNYSKNSYIGSFEKRNRDISSKLMSKMGYERKCLDKHAQGILEPIIVEERLRYLGLSYGESYGESSKAAMKIIETTPRRSFISGLLPQDCEDSILEECNGVKHTLQKEGVYQHTLEPKSCGNSDNLEEIVGVPKGATSSFNSPPNESNKGEREMYKSGSYHLPFDFVKHDQFPHR